MPPTTTPEFDDALASAITDLSKRITFYNEAKGFRDQGPVAIDRYLLLCMTEISEAFEELRDGHGPTEVYMDAKDLGARDGKPCGFPVELADAIIRLLDLAGRLNIPIGQLIKTKLAYNQTRPPKHGRKF
jgi:hypothetical protein